MTAYLVYIGEKLSEHDITYIVDTINPLKTLTTKILNINQGSFAVSFHDNAPLKGDKYFEDKKWIAVFAGDIIEESIPWEMILKALEKSDYQTLSNLSGYFSITALNKEKNELFIASDRRSQQPIFYLIDGKNVYISTELSTFCRLPVKVSFNIEWMWEYFFFHYPIGQTTFLENVKRMPPASVLEINIESGKYFTSEYANKFHKKKHILKGEEALEYAYTVFKNRIPKYFTGANNIACALTSGWDCRTNLSFCPNKNSLTTYTYGGSGCKDLIEASKTAQAMNINHKKILFDKRLEAKLQSLMFDTIYLSSGLEHITRATLLYVYKILTNNGKEHPLVISGIFWDGQFRGHAGPAVISPDMASMFSTGEKRINEEFWKECMGDHYASFKKHILKIIDNLEKEYGKLSEPESFLSYQIYELAPKYYAGELSIAKHFTTLRIPAWDTDILDLSYSIEHSTLSFSEYLSDHKRGSRDEMILQSYLITRNGGVLQDIAVGGVPPKTILKGENIYRFIRIKNLLPIVILNRVLRRKTAPLEDWKKWLDNNLKEIISQLIFSEKSQVKKYINPEYIDSLKTEPSHDYIAKLITVEIILKLLNNNWSMIQEYENRCYNSNKKQ